MDEKVKKLIPTSTNIQSAFTRMERFVGNYAVDPRPEQLDVRLKLINENCENYNNVQDELEELDHDSNNQQQCDEMEERYCYLTGLIEIKMKELELAETPELNVNTEPSVKVKLPQLSIHKIYWQLARLGYI